MTKKGMPLLETFHVQDVMNVLNTLSKSPMDPVIIQIADRLATSMNQRGSELIDTIRSTRYGKRSQCALQMARECSLRASLAHASNRLKSKMASLHQEI